jgi:hypothetical protein
LGRAHQAANTSDSQAIANNRTVNFLHVGQPAIAQDDPVGRNEVGLFEEQHIHGWVAGGWSL